MSNHDVKTLSTVRDIVAALGGTGETAAALGVLPSTVSNWLAYDLIPPKRFLEIADALQPHGRAPDRALFRELSDADRKSFSDRTLTVTAETIPSTVKPKVQTSNAN